MRALQPQYAAPCVGFWVLCMSSTLSHRHKMIGCNACMQYKICEICSSELVVHVACLAWWIFVQELFKEVIGTEFGEHGALSPKHHARNDDKQLGHWFSVYWPGTKQLCLLHLKNVHAKVEYWQPKNSMRVNSWEAYTESLRPRPNWGTVFSRRLCCLFRGAAVTAAANAEGIELKISMQEIQVHCDWR